MNPQIITIISGIALLVVLALAGWNLRRRHAHAENAARKKQQDSDE
ncbi:PEP-CTERM protein-sorting domain-containing protein [Rheinheimera pacifica]|jgi:FtsZ-interacting cell division protein ZipA|uniref:PEP-CTERM protein-sorting domain-containing protein n=2 Tax=Chromatiaceae TaxID=1046 RepID=A0A1H6NS80_9GAMM|nr:MULTISPECIES: hypothetical protein [Chromatiaceae]MBU1310940.1 hypothetical protein [Gammaproteobacteria bacterium]MBU1555045.1 hypothetical protein [Gammaproteobacteria bacterium]MBU2068828.1 hypothetical protein [Gammaproteobacteria bacterium]MBU2181623.1 hypothetical protein [Gammaproteobacteria bacterium]MBU2204639.1 hypothetical protein [Gammaproteobacteria bacterium]|tara:strand:+ start:161 stop:298 length:138 start_codon:yes stop_codon:yes gene_type:complete